jgi:hypothetical protein
MGAFGFVDKRKRFRTECLIAAPSDRDGSPAERDACFALGIRRQ